MQPNNEQAPGVTETTGSPSMPGLIDCLTVIFKYRRKICLFTLAVIIVTVVYSLLLPNIYTAKTLILPSQEDKGLMSSMMSQLGGLAILAAGAGASFGEPNTPELYVSMLKSEAVKDPIVDRFKLLEFYDKKFRTDVYSILDRNTSVSLGKKDGIITITYSDKDPRRAAAMANAYVEELGKLAVRLSVAGAGQNRDFLEERLVKARADLSKAEDDLRAFQAKNKAVNITAQAEATIKGVAELRAQLAAQEVQLATYRRSFTDSSQEVKNLSASVANLRAQIAKLEGAGNDSALPAVGAVPAIGQEYVRLMREFKIQESLVELLAKQYEMAKLSEAKDILPFQVIQRAKVPERKSRPHRATMLIIAVFCALFFSLVGIVILEVYKSMPELDKKKWHEIGTQLLFWKRTRL